MCSTDDFEDLEKRSKSGPDVECHIDYPCQCSEDGLDSTWQWSEIDEAWKCLGCGTIQDPEDL